jgi:hypothetical protein
MAGAHPRHEERAAAAPGNCAVHGEEITRQHGRGLRAREPPPRGPGAPRRGRHTQPSRHPPHRSGAHPDAEAGEFAPDPPVTPSPGSPPPAARSAPRPGRRQAAVLPGGDRSAAGRQAAGASAAACPDSPAGSSAVLWGAAGSGQRSPSGPPGPGPGFGFCRRSTATSWRNTSNPASSAAEPASSTIQPPVTSRSSAGVRIGPPKVAGCRSPHRR